MNKRIDIEEVRACCLCGGAGRERFITAISLFDERIVKSTQSTCNGCFVRALAAVRVEKPESFVDLDVVILIDPERIPEFPGSPWVDVK